MVCILRVFVCKPQGFIGESWEIIRYIYVCYFVFGVILFIQVHFGYLGAFLPAKATKSKIRILKAKNPAERLGFVNLKVCIRISSEDIINFMLSL